MGRIERSRVWGQAKIARGTAWVEQSRETVPGVDLAARLYERSRTTYLSVMGAAIALRLFLFVVPVVVMPVGILVALAGREGLDGLLDGSSVTGALATQIKDSVSATRSTGLALFGSAFVLSLWAGRNLTKVLAACAAGAWQLGVGDARATLRMAGSVTTLLLLVVVASTILNRLRTQYGTAVALSSLIVAAVIYSIGWFVTSWSLPRGTRDASAMLPGAFLAGVSLTGLQWFMQFYLPGRIERASEIMGTAGVSIAALGYFFILGRVLASSFVLNAVVFERFGSLSGVLFRLPLLRRVPGRFPRVAHFFGWDEAVGDAVEPVADPVAIDAVEPGS